jgi:hypothetical protein
MLGAFRDSHRCVSYIYYPRRVVENAFKTGFVHRLATDGACDVHAVLGFYFGCFAARRVSGCCFRLSGRLPAYIASWSSGRVERLDLFPLPSLPCLALPFPDVGG